MTVKPRTALYNTLSSVRFLLISIFFTVALLISVYANAFTSIAEYFPEIPTVTAYILAFIMNAAAITAMWLLFAGAKKRSAAVVSTGFKLLGVYAFALAFATLMFVVANDVDSAMIVSSSADDVEIVVETVAAILCTAAFGFFIYVLVLYGLSVLSFANVARYNKSLSKLPIMVSVTMIIASFSPLMLWPEAGAADLSFLAFALKLAASILVLIIANKYSRLSPRMTRAERNAFASDLADPEKRAAILAEADTKDPVSAAEQGFSQPGESTPVREWNENLPKLRAFATIPFDNGADYSESDRFNVICTSSFDPVPREPLSITAVSVIDDLVTGRRLLRIKAKNNAPIEVRSASFYVVIADKSGHTIGEMRLPSVAVNTLASGEEGFDNYAFIMPEDATFGVVKLTRVDLADGLYWDKGSEYYRFMTVNRPAEASAEDTAEKVAAEEAVETAAEEELPAVAPAEEETTSSDDPCA